MEMEDMEADQDPKFHDKCLSSIQSNSTAASFNQ